MRRIQFSFLFITISIIGTMGCIGDDIIFDRVDPVLRITNPVDTIAFEDSYQFAYSYLNNVGQEDFIQNVEWLSSDTSIVTISLDGIAHAKEAGIAKIIISATTEENIQISDTTTVVVGENTVVQILDRIGNIRTTSSYILEGSFTLGEVDGVLTLSIGEDYQASSNLPGLYVYLTNNPSTINGAFEIGRVQVFNGAHIYELPEEVGLNQYSHVLYFCKPFKVKIGDGEIGN